MEFFSVLNQINSFYIAASFTGIQFNIILPYVYFFKWFPSFRFYLTTTLYACQTSVIDTMYPSDLNSYILSKEHIYKTEVQEKHLQITMLFLCWSYCITYFG